MYGNFRTILKVGVSMTDELLSPAQAAGLAKCHNDTIRRAIEAGFLPAQRVGRNWIIKREDVQEWIETGRPNRRRKSSHETDEDAQQPQDDGTGNDQ
jgi:excisionase family DNA binding protein